MPTITRERLAEIQLPNDMKLSDVEMPKVDLSKVELPTRDDVGKAIAGAAAAVGLVRPQRRRWPYVLAAGLAIAAVGWVAMNWSTIRDRLDRLTAKASERMNSMRDEETWDESVAFTASETKPIEPSLDAVGPSTTLDDYPNGLGIESEKVGSARR
jgi:hypothetical protein